jgi:hypothetical protein
MKKIQKKLHKFCAVLGGKYVKLLTLTPFYTAETTYSAIWPKYWSMGSLMLRGYRPAIPNKKPPKLSLRGLSATTNVRITLGTRPHVPEIFWAHHIFNFTTNGVHVCHTHFSVVGLFIHDNNIMSRKK